MKKIAIIVIAAMSFIALLGSCDENRYDFSELDTVIASGQWKLPLGSFNVRMEQVLDQVAENELVSPDAEGNLQITYNYAMDPIVSGKDFMKMNDFDTPVTIVIQNPEGDVLHGEEVLTLESDLLQLISATFRSGSLVFSVDNAEGYITRAFVKSPNIFNKDHTPFQREINLDGETVVDMAGVIMESEGINTIQFLYDLYYDGNHPHQPVFACNGRIKVENLCIKELRGYVNSFPTSFRIDTSFTLPFNNVQGDIQFADARLSIDERNTFDVSAHMRIDTAMLYGNNVAPLHLFQSYPVEMDVHHSPTYTQFYDGNLNLELNTKFDKIMASGEIVFNPEGFGSEIVLTDESSIGVDAKAVVPIKFNIPDITYNDTVDLDMSQISVPDLVKEVVLHIDVTSELPFNFAGQLFTVDSETGVPTDSLFTDLQQIRGSFDGTPQKTQLSVDVTRQLLSNLMSTDKLLMRFRANTNQQNVSLNLDDKLQLTIKADVIYDGEINTSSFD